MWVFLSWWTTQLAGLLPDSITRRFRRPASATIIHAGTDSFALLTRSRGITASVAQTKPDDDGLQQLADALRKARGAPPLILMHVPPALVLHKSLSFPLGARHEVRNLLRFEIERETPFALNEIYWNYALQPEITAGGRRAVDLFLIPRRPVDALLERLRRAGVSPAAIEIETSAGMSRVFFAGDFAKPRRGRRLIPIAVAAMGALVALAAPFAYWNWEIASANAAIASLNDQALEATALRQSADRLAQTAELFKNHNTEGPLNALAAVTRLLPADTYLTSLALHGSRLTLSGLSPSAAGLVGLFARSQQFRDPSLDAPVVKNDSDGRENFTISVSLVQGGTK